MRTMARCLFALLVAALLAACTSPAAPLPDTLEGAPYRDSEFDFSINPPRGWIAHPGYSDLPAWFSPGPESAASSGWQPGDASPSPPPLSSPSDPDMPLLAVQIRATVSSAYPNRMDFETYVNQVRDASRGRTTVTVDRATMINGVRAHLLGGTHSDGDRRLHTIAAILVTNRPAREPGAFVLLGICLEDVWEQYGTVFEASLMTFRLIDG